MGVYGMSDYIVREFQERRIKQPPIPDNYEQLLNQNQLRSLRELEESGWHLEFIRRPLFQPVMPVLVDLTGFFTVILEEDGLNNINHGMQFRLH